MKEMLGCADTGFDAIHAIALNAAINESILAVPDACFVTAMALPSGKRWPGLSVQESAPDKWSLRRL